MKTMPRLHYLHKINRSDIHKSTMESQLTMQLDGESVLHVHTARLGNPSYS